ncbi:hypothetical protein [Pandoraea aquatica]|nr:hypothetical protein [Pandoraea aquatica]
MDYTSLTAEQLRSLIAEIIETRGDSLSRTKFTDEFLSLLEDVPGREGDECSAALVDVAWVAYTDVAPHNDIDADNH